MRDEIKGFQWSVLPLFLSGISLEMFWFLVFFVEGDINNTDGCAQAAALADKF